MWVPQKQGVRVHLASLATAELEKAVKPTTLWVNLSRIRIVTTGEKVLQTTGLATRKVPATAAGVGNEPESLVLQQYSKKHTSRMLFVF
jgi:hypothetical protein